MKSIRHINIKTLALAVAALSLPQVVQAKDAYLEEIVITAQKRAESLQDVPVSVSALTSADLEGLRLGDTTEIAAQIPNLQASAVAGEGMPIFSLRGVSMNDFSFNQNAPVAVYVDEVYKGTPALQGIQIYDLERIEVLRGPQGTLYGKNSTGGAVNFITKRPEMGENQGYFTAGIGDYNRKELEGAVNLTLSDKLAFRLAGTWTEADGWQDNKTPGVENGSSIDDVALRLSLLWDVSDSLQLLLRTARGESKGINYGIVAENVGALFGGPIGFGFYGSGPTRDGLDIFEIESDQDERRKIENNATSLTINWEMDNNLSLTSITSYDEGENFVPEDADGSAQIVVNARQGSEVEQFAQDLRITSDYDAAFNFIAGAYYANEEVAARTTLQFYQDLDLDANGILDSGDCIASFSMPGIEGFGCQQQNNFDQERTSMAAYFDSSYELSQGWTLRFGIRYTEDETRMSNYAARILGSDDALVAVTIPRQPKDEFTDDEVTGKIGLDYTTTNGTLVYGSFSHGYRTGAFNAQAFNTPAELTQADAEILDAWEIGIKTQILDGKMQLNGALFHYAYESQQFLDVAADLTQTLINIDESEILGVELELTARPVEQLMLRAGLGLLDSEVKSGVLGGVNLQGNALPQAPEVNFNVGIDWDVLSTDVGNLTVHFDATYTDKQFFDVFNVERTQADDYLVTNGRISFESASEVWAVSVWGKNLFEEKYRTSIIDLQAFGNYDYTHVGAPRAIGADLTVRF